MSLKTRIRRHSALIPVGILALALAGVASTSSLLPSHLSSGGTATLRVTLTDQRLVLSHEGMRAGETTVILVKQGRRRHSLTISGPGLLREASRTVPAGKTAKLTLTLRKGAYLFADPLLGATRARWVMVTPAGVAGSNTRTTPPDSLTSTAGMNCDAE